MSLEGVAGRGADHQVLGQLADGLVTEVTDQVGLEQRLGPVREGVSEAVGDDDTTLPEPEPSVSLAGDCACPDETATAHGGFTDRGEVAVDDAGVVEGCL